MTNTDLRDFSDDQWLEFNEAIIEEFRANGGKCGGRFEGNPMILMTTTGARSGRRTATPITYTTDGEDLVVIASKAGSDSHPAWYHNLVANPDVTVEVGSETFEARAVPAEEPERTRLFDQQVAQMPRFGGYQEKTDRVIPVVVITRK